VGALGGERPRRQSTLVRRSLLVGDQGYRELNKGKIKKYFRGSFCQEKDKPSRPEDKKGVLRTLKWMPSCGEF